MLQPGGQRLGSVQACGAMRRVSPRTEINTGNYTWATPLPRILRWFWSPYGPFLMPASLPTLCQPLSKPCRLPDQVTGVSSHQVPAPSSLPNMSKLPTAMPIPLALSSPSPRPTLLLSPRTKSAFFPFCVPARHLVPPHHNGYHCFNAPGEPSSQICKEQTAAAMGRSIPADGEMWKASCGNAAGAARCWRLQMLNAVTSLQMCGILLFFLMLLNEER